MANTSIKNRISSCAVQTDAEELRYLLNAALADLTMIKTAYDILAAKLNADTGVADEDYATLGALTLVA